jgi:hypothetical protein
MMVARFGYRQLTVAFGVLLLASASAAAPTETKRTVPDEYTGTTANLTEGAGTRVSIQILRWLSDSDRQAVVSAVNAAAGEGPDDLSKAIAALPTVGYIWCSGPLGYALKYAHRVIAPDGDERVVVMTDRPLGSWEHPAWKITGPVADTRPFTVVELHLNKKGKGDGKTSLTSAVAVDEQAKTIGVADYVRASTLLTDVERQPKPYWVRESDPVQSVKSSAAAR